MNNIKITNWSVLAVLILTFVACKNDKAGLLASQAEKTTISVKNVLNATPLVESGVFKDPGSPLPFSRYNPV